MFRKLIRKIASYGMDGVLAVAFMAFCVYVGLAGVPQLLTNTVDLVTEDVLLDAYIEVVDEQYYEMLTTEKTASGLQNKVTYINFGGWMAEVMGQPEFNEMVKLKNGSLSSEGFYYTEEDLYYAYYTLSPLARKQAERGKKFLFVLAPAKNFELDTAYPVGYPDTTNEDIMYFLELLEQNNIDYLDLRENMVAEGMTHDEVFYMTDHHWTAETSFWAYTKILDKLKENGSITDVNSFYTDADNYEFEVHEDSFLGSQGRRTGIGYVDVEDFCLITPKYETQMSLNIPSSDFTLTGSFEETAFSDYGLDALLSKDFFNGDPYGIYGWSNRPRTIWSNPNAPEDQKVMMIGNSYGNIPFAFLSLYFSSCEELDMRYFTEDFTSLYESYEPDIVIVLVNVNSMGDENVIYPYFME